MVGGSQTTTNEYYIDKLKRDYNTKLNSECEAHLGGFLGQDPHGTKEIFDKNINYNDSILGEGNFGMVKKGVLTQHDIGTNINVAVKELKQSASDDDITHFSCEGLISAQFEHENVCRFLGVVKTVVKTKNILQYKINVI